MMYNYSDIKSVHLEITENCQAACPQCDRNQNGGDLNPHLNLNELSLDECEQIFPVDFIKQLNTMYMCGNFGDPMVAKDTLEVFRYFRSHNPNIWLGMNTNGGGRTSEWWGDLAKIFGRMGAVIFSLDGLEDTNHLYRQNVSWSKAMNAAESFIHAGGRARWDFLVFAHNQHQVEEAKLLSERMGFEKFIPKKTGRFYSNIKKQGKNEHQAVNRKGEQTQKLEKPNEKFLNKSLTKEQSIIQKYGSMDAYFDQVPIRCKVAEQKSIYISAEGLLMPCCWLAGQLYKWYWPEHHSPVWDHVDKIGKDNINSKRRPIKEIMESGLLQSIESSWSKPSVKEGKLWMCAKTCGKEFDPFGDQFK